eukprot:SAG11_NODE_184_length_13162_cov_9.151803_4_plen_63_part_00
MALMHSVQSEFGGTPTTIQNFNAALKRREGWGLSHDADHIYVTDGSAQIYVYSPGAEVGIFL